MDNFVLLERNASKLVENKIQPNMIQLSKLTQRVADGNQSGLVEVFVSYGLFWVQDLTPAK